MEFEELSPEVRADVEEELRAIREWEERQEAERNREPPPPPSREELLEMAASFANQDVRSGADPDPDVGVNAILQFDGVGQAVRGDLVEAYWRRWRELGQ